MCPSGGTAMALRKKKICSSRQINDFKDFSTNFSNTKIKPNGLDSALLEIKMDIVFQAERALSDCSAFFDDLVEKG